MTRAEKAVCALWDLATREGATRESVMKGMKDAGFTASEISEAAKKMEGAA